MSTSSNRQYDVPRNTSRSWLNRLFERHAHFPRSPTPAPTVAMRFVLQARKSIDIRVGLPLFATSSGEFWLPQPIRRQRARSKILTAPRLPSRQAAPSFPLCHSALSPDARKRAGAGIRRRPALEEARRPWEQAHLSVPRCPNIPPAEEPSWTQLPASF